MKGFWLQILAMGALASASSVLAADSNKKLAANRKLMHDYARCVVKRKRDRARDAIMANSDNSTITHHYSDLIIGECLAKVGGDGMEMTFGGDLYRYALADALVNDGFATKGEASFSDRLPLAHPAAPDRASFEAELAQAKGKRRKDDIRARFDKSFAIAWLSRYGECIARREPAKSRLWILTPPDGPEEISRIKDLQPAFSACLGDGTVKFNRVTMRGLVAINYYRLAMATRVPSIGKSQ